MSSVIKNSLKVCFWNLGGIITQKRNKLDDPAFVKEIQEYDVIVLAETHIGYNTKLHIEGYNYYPLCREISNNGRYYGGLGIFRKTIIKDHIKIIQGMHKDFLWIKFEKDFFKLKNDLYLCAAYIPPSNSSYTQKLDHDLTDLIEKDLLVYKQKGDVLILGDLNARTSNKDDFITNDNSNHLPLFDSYKPDNSIRYRKSMDHELDERGKEIIDICISNHMRIVNGRKIGDLHGQYTCFNAQGQSVVDYLLAGQDIIEQILYFHVADFLSTFSDCHCKISFEIMAKFSEKPLKNNPSSLMKINYKWGEGSATKFQEAFSSSYVQQK